MSTIGDELLNNTDEIIQRWYDAWRKTTSADECVSEAALKDDIPRQLKFIGEQIQNLDDAEAPERMWKNPERLDPEKRVEQHTPIEEVVQEYSLAVRTVRDWVEERGLDPDFREYSYFYSALFELAAESVRRYANHQAKVVREDRAQYLAGVMHQLRTPLSALSMQTELVADHGARPDEAFIARLQRNVRRMEELVNRILRLERFQPGECPVNPQDVFPARIIDDLMSDQERAAARKGLRFEAHVNRSMCMKLDPNLFIDALGNLVHNAIKYTNEGRVIVDAVEHPKEVLFRVRDSGPGIPPEKQRTLFKDAQPGHASGAGIGLQIAEHAAQAQGGRITVESEIGKGTIFNLRLPREVKARRSD